jgi:putative membrane protein
MRLIGYLLVNTAALLITAYLLPFVTVDNFQSAVVAAVVIGVINTIIKPVLQLLALPLTLLTLGLFSFILNVLLLMAAAYVTPGFHIDGFLGAAIAAIVLSLVSSFLGMLTK